MLGNHIRLIVGMFFIFAFLGIVASPAMSGGEKDGANGDEAAVCPACEGSGIARCDCEKGKLEVDCAECFGYGKAACKKCRGHGTVPCPKCGTKGVSSNVKCLSCQNRHKVDCGKCKGEGFPTCSKCKGTGKERIRCLYCRSGADKPACPVCGGTGKETVRAPETCPFCAGTGKTACTRCRGTLKIFRRCNRCSGKGEIDVCPFCYKSGRTICWKCNGDSVSISRPSGKAAPTNWISCGYCMGRGAISCPFCDENVKFKCRECRGTGIDKSAKCPSCSEAGVFTCPFCDGESVIAKKASDDACPVCNGEKEIDSRLLNFGRTLCPTCAGKLTVGCGNCVKGTQKCPTCKGKGCIKTRGAYRKDPLECTACAGVGTIQCVRCEGSGGAICPDCETLGWSFQAIAKESEKGAEKVPCPYCEGKGKVDRKVDFMMAFQFPPTPMFKELLLDEPLFLCQARLQAKRSISGKAEFAKWFKENCKGKYVLEWGEVLGHRKDALRPVVVYFKGRTDSVWQGETHELIDKLDSLKESGSVGIAAEITGYQERARRILVLLKIERFIQPRK